MRGERNEASNNKGPVRESSHDEAVKSDVLTWVLKLKSGSVRILSTEIY